MWFAVDADDDVVQMPFVIRLRCAPADLVGKVTAKPLGPAPPALMTGDDPADGQQILDHSQAERKAKVQPERLCDDVSRTAVASIAGVSNIIHHTGIPRNALHPVNVTVPMAASSEAHIPLSRAKQLGNAVRSASQISSIQGNRLKVIERSL